jgi:hypothetical protein
MPGSRFPNKYHPFWRSLAWWIFVTLAVLAAFILIRKLTLCWTLTILPAFCGTGTENSSRLPDPDQADTPNAIPIQGQHPGALPKEHRDDVADGVIVGCSACVKSILGSESPVEAAREFARSFRDALRGE